MSWPSEATNGELCAVVAGATTGMRDMDGAPLFDGDWVVEFGGTADRTTCQIRRFAYGDGTSWAIVSPEGWLTGLPALIASDRKYGVRKIPRV